MKQNHGSLEGTAGLQESLWSKAPLDMQGISREDNDHLRIYRISFFIGIVMIICYGKTGWQSVFKHEKAVGNVVLQM